MRRSLMLTVAATVSMVLIAMLVPLAVLIRSYALEDRLSRAALEVQATETVVARQDKGAVAQYLDQVNRGTGSKTTVFYPDGIAVGPDSEPDPRIESARLTGQARLDDVPGGSQILVPVSQGGSSALPTQTPVIRVIVEQPGLRSEVGRAWILLTALGSVLLIGSLILADRLGKSFVQPIRDLAARTHSLDSESAPIEPGGPPEIRELGQALSRLVGRVDLLLRRERESVSDLSHRLRTPITTLRLRAEGIRDPEDRIRIGQDLDDLEAMVDQIIRDARRSEREGVDPRVEAVSVLRQRADFWRPLAEDQSRSFEVAISGLPEREVRISEDDLASVVDALMDNVFSHTPEGTAVAVTIEATTDGVVLTCADSGPGFPASLDVRERGTSGADSTGLGLAIIDRIAEESGGSLELGRSSTGGATVVVRLGLH